jgi:hypothetical protein
MEGYPSPILFAERSVWPSPTIRAFTPVFDGLRRRHNKKPRGGIEAGIVMPGDRAAAYFTTTVVPTDTRL